MEQDDGGCGSGPEGQGVAGQDAAEVLYPLVVGHRCRVARDRLGQPEPSCHLAGYAPLEEGPDGIAVVLAALGVPGVDVCLAAPGQGKSPRGEPLEEFGGAQDLADGVASRTRAERLLLCPRAEPGQDFPGGETADDLGVGLIASDAHKRACGPQQPAVSRLQNAPANSKLFQLTRRTRLTASHPRLSEPGKAA